MTDKKKLQQIIDKALVKLDVKSLNQAMVLNDQLELLDTEELEQVAGELATAIGDEYDAFQDDKEGLILISVSSDYEAEKLAKEINQRFKNLNGLDVYAVVVETPIHKRNHPDYALDTEFFVEVRVDADYLG